MADADPRTFVRSEPVISKVAGPSPAIATHRPRKTSDKSGRHFVMHVQQAANGFDDRGRKDGTRQFIDETIDTPGLAAHDHARRR